MRDGIADDWLLLPAHPWQSRRLLDHSRAQALIATGRLWALGEADSSWAATSSVRAVYRRESPWMLKFSLSARLTNAMRVLTPTEDARGFSVHGLLDAGLRERLAATAPTLGIIGEPAALALDDGSGAPLPESFAVLRKTPFAAPMAIMWRCSPACASRMSSTVDPLGGYYEAQPWDRGWHGLVGSRRHLGRQRTHAWARALFHYLFLEDPRTQCVVGEPRADNTKLIRALQPLGAQADFVFDFPHKRARLMRCERRIFFARGGL